MLFIRRVIQQYPEIYEDEIQEWIQFALGKTIHVSMIAKLLKKMGFTLRKVHIACLIFGLSHMCVSSKSGSSTDLSSNISLY